VDDDSLDFGVLSGEFWSREDDDGSYSRKGNETLEDCGAYESCCACEDDFHAWVVEVVRRRDAVGWEEGESSVFS